MATIERTHYSLSFTVSRGKKKSVMFWWFLHLKGKPGHKIKTYIIQCQKLVIYSNHPSFIFSNTEKKTKQTWFNNSVFGSLSNTVIQINVPGAELCGVRWQRTGLPSVKHAENPLVKVTWVKDMTPYPNVHKKAFEKYPDLSRNENTPVLLLVSFLLMITFWFLKSTFLLWERGFRAL